MRSGRFRSFPVAEETMKIYPKEKGVLLFYDSGKTEEKYGREHAIMLQEIGYWYIDNIQDFLLNYSYNGVIVMLFESDTSLVYLPKNISMEQREAVRYYFDNNISAENKDILKFFILQCLEKNNDIDDEVIIERNNRGLLKKYRGKDVTNNKPIGYSELYNYLDSISLKDKSILKK